MSPAEIGTYIGVVAAVLTVGNLYWRDWRRNRSQRNRLQDASMVSLNNALEREIERLRALNADAMTMVQQSKEQMSVVMVDLITLQSDLDAAHTQIKHLETALRRANQRIRDLESGTQAS